MSGITIDVQGCAVPALGFGTWQLEGDDCEHAVRTALEIGYRHIDTAQMYGNEASVGRAIAAGGVDRAELFVTTKLGSDNVSDARVGASLDESLAKLGSDYVDLLLIHWPSREVPLAETLAAMRAAQEAGKARLIGVSNFPSALLQTALAQAPIACNQVECHVYLSQRSLAPLCRERGILLTAYSPLARGRIDADSTLKEIGERYGKQPTQIALRYLLQRGGIAAIPKASSRAHIAANFAIFDFQLQADDCARIAALDQGLRICDPDFAPDWDDDYQR